MKTIAIKGLFTRRVFWDGDDKERARKRFERNWPGVPHENQDLPNMGNIPTGYWIQTPPAYVQGQTIYWEIKED